MGNRGFDGTLYGVRFTGSETPVGLQHSFFSIPFVGRGSRSTKHESSESPVTTVRHLLTLVTFTSSPLVPPQQCTRHSVLCFQDETKKRKKQICASAVDPNHMKKLTEGEVHTAPFREPPFTGRGICRVSAQLQRGYDLWG